MCLSTFNEFIENNRKYKKFVSSINAKNVYDYLKRAESIQSMIAANNNGRPALYGVQSYIEANFEGHLDFDFNEGFVKQCVGSMVREILEPFGFKPLRQRDLPKNESKYFTSATYYSLDESIAKCKLITKLEIQKIEK